MRVVQSRKKVVLMEEEQIETNAFEVRSADTCSCKWAGWKVQGVRQSKNGNEMTTGNPMQNGKLVGISTGTRARR